MAEYKQLENIHAGHRQRMMGKFNAIDPDAIPDHELLEMLLYYSITRADTNAIAHRLLIKFSTLKNVFEADIDSLMSVQGIGRKSADLIKICYDIMRRCEMQRINSKNNIKYYKNVGDVRSFLASHFSLQRVEKFGVMFLDASYRLIEFKFISTGNANSVKIDKVKLILLSRVLGATFVYLAHNHPNGSAQPTPEDQRITMSLKNELAQESIFLMDHFIIAEDKCVSVFASRKVYF